MKKIILIVFIALFSISHLFAEIDAYFMYSVFNSKKGPYVETYLSFIGNSLKYVKENDAFFSKVEVSVFFTVGDSIVFLDKYTINSSPITDTASPKPNFVDVQRYLLNPGLYNIKIKIQDLNSSDPHAEFIDKIPVNVQDTNIFISSIEYLESYTETKEQTIISKSGYDLVPYVSNFFPTNLNKLNYYFEIYNCDKVFNENFILKIYIENDIDKTLYQPSLKLKKMEPENIIPYLGSIDISSLYSGNYSFVIEILDKEQKLILQQKFIFQRSNINKEAPDDTEKVLNANINSFSGKMFVRDSLVDYVLSLRPLAQPKERHFIDFVAKKSNLLALQNFFCEFWNTRSQTNPNALWEKYWEQVLYTNRAFGRTKKKGYETDMGYVYLKYGAPNEVYESEISPSAYQYKIWKYWHLDFTNENNRKFVFYNPTGVGRDFDLLHSNAKGELQVANWERFLQKRNNDMYNFDKTESDETWGENALREFNR